MPAGRLRGPITPRAVTELNREVRDEVELVRPESRWAEVDGRRIQGWYYPPNPLAEREPKRARPGAARRRDPWRPAHPLRLDARCGSGRSWPAAGMGVWAANPRGSQGYGEAFNGANFRDWGPGPMRDIMAGVDSLIAEDRADPERLGVTGGSYGGYLTSWIVGHTDRFRAAITCRSVNDLTSQMSTGDIAGPSLRPARVRGGALGGPRPVPRSHSPLTYASQIRTPLLIQHSERDLRTPIGQAEELFTVLRSLRRPVRLMRVPDETHELTRSGTRRSGGSRTSVQIRAWFEHFLVDGGRDLPPLPRDRAGPLGRGPVVTTVRPARPTPRPARRRDELIRSFDERAGSLGSLLGRVTPVDQVGVEERVDSLKRRSIKKASKLWALDLAIRMMDLTTLEGKDTPGKVRALCAKAIQPLAGRSDDPPCRRDLRLPGPRRRRQGGPGDVRRARRQRRDRLPVGPDVPGHQARRDAPGGRGGRRRDRHGHRPGRVPGRRLRHGLRRDRGGQGGLRRRPTSR